MKLLKMLNPFKKKGVEELSTPFGKVIGEQVFGYGIPHGALKEIQSSAVYSCIRVLCNSASILPTKIHDISDNSQSDKTDLPLWRVLNRRPNPFQSPAVFKAQILLHMVLKGNYFGWINRVNGKVVSIIPMNSDYVQVEQNRYYETRFVWTNPTTAERRTLKSEDVLHIPGLVYDGPLGLALREVASRMVNLDLSLQDHSSAFFENQAMPGQVVLHSPAHYTQERAKQLVDDFEARYTGPNKRKTLLLYGGLDAKSLMVSAQDSQFLEQRKHVAVEICGALGVPPFMIGILEKATFNNMEQLGIMFVTHGMLPHLVRIEEALGLACLGADSNYYCKFNVDALLRGDAKSQAEILNIERQNGVISANEWRGYKGRAPVEGGDTFLQPLNMAPLGNTTQKQ